MFLFFSNEKALAGLDEVGRTDLVDRHIAFNFDVLERRTTVLVNRALQPTPTATTVRPHGGGMVAVPGPHAATDEALVGFYLLECRDLDEAIELAALYPMPEGLGCIEIRPALQSWDYTQTVQVPVPPAEVWRHYADVAGWPSWIDGIDTVALDGPLATGATGTVRAGSGPATAVRVVTASVDRGYVIETEVAPGVWLRMEHMLAPLPDGTTRITHRAVVPRAALDHLGAEYSPALNARIRSTLHQLHTVLDPVSDATSRESSDVR